MDYITRDARTFRISAVTKQLSYFRFLLQLYYNIIECMEVSNNFLKKKFHSSIYRTRPDRIATVMFEHLGRNLFLLL